MSLFGGSPTSSLLGGFSGGGGGALPGGILPVGANPYNPLQGQPAVSGIGQFINQMLTLNTLRKAGLLPPSGPQAAAGGLAGLLGGAGGGGDLQAMLGALVQQFSALMGGAPAAPAAAPAAPAADASVGSRLNLLA